MRSWVLTLTIVAILALAAACGNGEDDQDDEVLAADETPTEVAETPTPEPEADPDPTETPTPEPEPTEPPVEDPTPTPESTDDSEPADDTNPAENGTPGDLNALLLSLDDLPAGWTEALEGFNPEVDADDTTPFEAPCGVEPLEDAYGPALQAHRTFQGTELGPFLTQNLAQMGSTGEAETAMSQVRELFSCDEWFETDVTGDELRFEVNEFSFGDVGDEMFAVSIGFSIPTDPEFDLFGDVSFDFVFFRRGEYISTVWYADFFGMSGLEFESIVQAADQKIQAGT